MLSGREEVVFEAVMGEPEVLLGDELLETELEVLTPVLNEGDQGLYDGYG